jgi:hypothetical protein
MYLGNKEIYSIPPPPQNSTYLSILSFVDNTGFFPINHSDLLKVNVDAYWVFSSLNLSQNFISS